MDRIYGHPGDVVTTSSGREDLLRQVPLFEDLRIEQLAELMGRATRQTARKGGVIIAEGDADPNFLVF